jgi:hypothetical protein
MGLLRGGGAGPRLAATALAVTVGAAGCGASTDYRNQDRPPAPINLTAVISPRQVSVSPVRFGAGPIVLIVTNQTGASQRLTLTTADSIGRHPITQSTGPINPRDTASLAVDVPPGDYRVKVGDRTIRATNLHVGRSRATAQNELLQP